MNALNAISLSVGLWVGIWCFGTLGFMEPKVMTWVTFLTWASFFAAGGGVTGLKKAIAGGFAPRAAKWTVDLTRVIDGVPATATVPLTYPVRPGDTITVRERFF